jgi:Tfp pilus assembly PilM family ATPase
MDEKVNSVGFSISRENLYWVILSEKDDERIEVKELDRFQFNSPLDYSDLLCQENRLKIYRSIQKQAEAGKFQDLKANLGLDSAITYIISIPIDNNLNPEEIENQLHWEFTALMGNKNIRDYHLFYHKIKTPRNDKTDSLILLIVRKRFISFFKNIFEDLNININVTDVDHFCLETACRYNYSNFNHGNSIVVSDKYSMAEISFIAGGEFFNYRQIKKSKDESLNDFFQKHLLPLVKKRSQSSPIKIFLSTEQISKNTYAELTSNFPVDIELINPFRQCIINKTVLNSLVYENVHCFAPAVGVALRRG